MITKIAETATNWADSSHPSRVAAIEDTLAAPNQWTEPALDHALNRWMQTLTQEALNRWLGDFGPGPTNSPTVGVIHADGDPFSGFRDAIASWGLGFNYVGTVSDGSPAILPSFAAEVFGDEESDRFEFASRDETLERADVLIADATEDTEASLREQCDAHTRSSSHYLVRPPVYSAGIVDGHESEDEMERLAEDMLLFEGKGRRRLAILWAPRDHAPDAYLEAMARFRGLFPAHEDTPGTLQMQQAFLDARDESHAYADGLEFLVSRGDPTPQRPCHIRWVEYDDMDDVHEWITSETDEIYAVIARRHLHDKLSDSWSLRKPGGVHIPPLDDADGRETVSFLRSVTDTV